jgi:hypothetical protein
MGGALLLVVEYGKSINAAPTEKNQWFLGNNRFTPA